MLRTRLVSRLNSRRWVFEWEKYGVVCGCEKALADGWTRTQGYESAGGCGMPDEKIRPVFHVQGTSSRLTAGLESTLTNDQGRRWRSMTDRLHVQQRTHNESGGGCSEGRLRVKRGKQKKSVCTSRLWANLMTYRRGYRCGE